MAADVIVAQELKSLQEELSASQKARLAAAEAAPPVTPLLPSPGSTEPITEAANEHELLDQLGDIASEVTDFFEQAERGVTAHPAQSVVAALLVGILIGRILGRR